MQRILIGIVAVVVMLVVIFVGAGSADSESAILRIHIRANSNLAVDQAVKYEIKDAVVEYLTPLVSRVVTVDDAKAVITARLGEIKRIADGVLAERGFEYESAPKINNEYFPTRDYEGYVVESGYYDALIVELGEAKGNNWWCVVYPPLCFVDSKYTKGDGVVYKSKIVSIIESFYKSTNK